MGTMTAWERMQIVHHKGRPTIHDYLPLLASEFYEMHGDRQFADDGAIIAGIARIQGEPVTLIAQVKGRNIEENKASNFAMPHPEGYRKAVRLAKQAEKFGRPVVCMIDTPGAFCGIGAEERGQGEAIARSMMEFMSLRTPVISIVLGEGGSGGALALGVCDELAMLENATYSVISPRGCASILWKDASREEEAANLLRITAEDLVEFGICDYIIPEPAGGAHNNLHVMVDNLSEYIRSAIERLRDCDMDELLEKRYQKYRRIGKFLEE